MSLQWSAWILFRFFVSYGNECMNDKVEFSDDENDDNDNDDEGVDGKIIILLTFSL